MNLVFVNLTPPLSLGGAHGTPFDHMVLLLVLVFGPSEARVDIKDIMNATLENTETHIVKRHTRGARLDQNPPPT
jgi:hypothetical protein